MREFVVVIALYLGILAVLVVVALGAIDLVALIREMIDNALR